MNSKNLLLQKLANLISLKISSYDVRDVGEDVLMLAFKNQKPLFTIEEKPEAAKLVETSLPFLETALDHVYCALNIDTRQHAQIYRSGLQFLIDDFKEDLTVYEKLKLILVSTEVENIEKYILDTNNIPKENLLFVDFLSQRDKLQIISSHTWWF